jgi:hypothetical protein
MRQAIGDLTRATLGLLLLQRVDQFDGLEEPNPLVVMLDGLDADRGGNVRLARAGTADQDDIVGGVEELAAMELQHQGLVDRPRPRRGPVQERCPDRDLAEIGKSTGAGKAHRDQELKLGGLDCQREWLPGKSGRKVKLAVRGTQRAAISAILKPRRMAIIRKRDTIRPQS